MLVHPDERVPIARLLTFLEYGEYLAQDCARAQAALAPEQGMQRFLLSQARQEAAHAWVFQGAIAWLAPKHLGDSPFLPAREQYRVLVEDALQRRDFPETLMAEQIILEGLGEAILARIEEGLAKRSAPFGRLRRVLLHQEEAHRRPDDLHSQNRGQKGNGYLGPLPGGGPVPGGGPPPRLPLCPGGVPPWPGGVKLGPRPAAPEVTAGGIMTLPGVGLPNPGCSPN